ncbi:hypothetical protein [Endozoicomonas sp. ONNA1]|uniref:hypothetical protein n=1 Tax=Endozoicomonas sp. ONNA1 TaxID=2828740 RepID=UPI0021476EAC|nr:hypothetical protein [Endozoicomonas sp. ONNA1]
MATLSELRESLKNKIDTFLSGTINVQDSLLLSKALAALKITEEKAATLAETVAGTLNTVFVTPQTMRWGFQYSFGTSAGYIFFPDWLMGFGFQWVYNPPGVVSGIATINLPITYPNQLFGAVVLESGGISNGIVAPISTVVDFNNSTLSTVIIGCYDISTQATRAIGWTPLLLTWGR